MTLFAITPYSLHFAWLLSGLAAVLAIITIVVLMRPMIKVGKHKAPQAEPVPENAPKVSVVVCAGNREEDLHAYLDVLTQQDYPNFEIIVVSESTSEQSEILAESCQRKYQNVYVTFIPPGSHNLSRRKLALTLGMKAASGEIVVTTVSNAAIPSTAWLSQLIAPFLEEGGENIDLSLGYSHEDFTQMNSALRWYREFDSLMTDSRWLGYVLAHKPYRGDGYNLAMRREIFFRNKGYSRSIGVQTGDDDIFIHEIATPANTAAVLSPESILTIEWGEASSRIWKERKEQYHHTSHWLPQTPFTLAGVFSAMQWIIPILCIGAILIGGMFYFDNLASDHSEMIQSLLATITALIVWGGFLLTEILIYRKCASRLGATRLWWSLPLFMLIKPISNLIFRLRHRH